MKRRSRRKAISKGVRMEYGVFKKSLILGKNKAFWSRFLREAEVATRAIIAKKLKNDEWIGVYHHWDGYPSVLGKTIWNMIVNEFKSVNKFCRYAIEEHPAGWFHIFPAPCVEKSPEDQETINASIRKPQCFCHGYFAERDGITPSKEHLITSKQFRKTPYNWNPEWLYIITPKKMIIQCCYGAYKKDKVNFAVVAEVNFKKPEPNWKDILELGLSLYRCRFIISKGAIFKNLNVIEDFK